MTIVGSRTRLTEKEIAPVLLWLPMSTAWVPEDEGRIFYHDYSVSDFGEYTTCDTGRTA